MGEILVVIELLNFELLFFMLAWVKQLLSKSIISVPNLHSTILFTFNFSNKTFSDSSVNKCVCPEDSCLGNTFSNTFSNTTEGENIGTEKNKYWVYKINKTWVEMDEVCLVCLKKEREKNGEKL